MIIHASTYSRLIMPWSEARNRLGARRLRVGVLMSKGFGIRGGGSRTASFKSGALATRSGATSIMATGLKQKVCWTSVQKPIRDGLVASLHLKDSRGRAQIW